jgi:hypothetical protein
LLSLLERVAVAVMETTSTTKQVVVEAVEP